MPRTKSEIAANARRKDLLSNFRTNIATLKAGDLDDMDYRRGKYQNLHCKLGQQTLFDGTLLAYLETTA